MIEKEFDSHLPNLEQAGWEPGMPWAPTIEQQPELDISLEAEQMVDSEERVHFNLADGELGIPYTPQDPESRKKAIQENIKFLKSKEDYENRSPDAVLSDIVAWLDAFDDTPERSTIDDILEREAAAFLKKLADHDHAPVLDSELEALAILWATIRRGAVAATDEFDSLFVYPINDRALQLTIDDREVDIVSANLMVLESKMLDRVEETDLEPTPIHPYSIFLYKYGR